MSLIHNDFILPLKFRIHELLRNFKSKYDLQVTSNITILQQLIYCFIINYVKLILVSSDIVSKFFIIKCILYITPLQDKAKYINLPSTEMFT